MAKRAMWSGSITFGLVNVPVRMYSVVHNKDVHFHLMSKEGQCRLRRKLYCPETGEEFDFKETARGYEIAPDQYVIVNEDELDRLKPEAGRTIEITDFVDLHEIDPVFYNTPYYLGPGKDGQKPYKLLLEAMTEAGKVGIAKFVMREKEYLAAIRPLKKALCLETMYFADEVTDADEVPDVPVEARVQQKEVDVARRLIDALASEFDPGKYQETYREQMVELIKKKAKGKKIVQPQAEQEEAPRVLSLMKALEESLQEAKKARKRRKSA